MVSYFKGIIKTTLYFALVSAITFGAVYAGVTYKAEIMESISMMRGAFVSMRM